MFDKLLAATFIPFIGLPILGQELIRVKVGSLPLRSQAFAAATPVYPPNAIFQKREGKVIIAVTVGVEGAVTNVEIKEATSRDFELAVRSAVSAWQFHPPRLVDGRKAAISGVLAFYFRITDGRPEVIDAAQQSLLGSRLRM
ncbi:MAG: energy transducer TonB [Bryobacteraceae bacterium]|nr:energy transducer TonB [Bryobacteraceae bacterium]